MSRVRAGAFTSILGALAFTALLSLSPALLVWAQGQGGPSGSLGYVAYTLILYNNTLVSGNAIARSGSRLFPNAMAYDSSNGYIYVSDWGTNSVSVIDPANDSVIGNISAGVSPDAIAYDPI